MTAIQPQQERRLTTLPAATRGGTPPGLYVMQLVDVLDAGVSQFANAKGEYEQQAKWVCKIVKVIDSDADNPEALVGSEWWKWTNLKMGSRSNMRKFTEAFLGRALDEAGNEQLDVDAIIGAYAKVHLAEKQGDKGLEIHVTMSPFKAERKAQRAAKPAPPPEPAADDDDWSDEPDDNDPF